MWERGELSGFDSIAQCIIALQDWRKKQQSEDTEIETSVNYKMDSVLRKKRQSIGRIGITQFRQ